MNSASTTSRAARVRGPLVFEGRSCSRAARVRGPLVFEGRSCSRAARGAACTTTRSCARSPSPSCSTCGSGGKPTAQRRGAGPPPAPSLPEVRRRLLRSEEHTSELQSRQYLVCRLLLEKKTPLTPPPDVSLLPSAVAFPSPPLPVSRSPPYLPPPPLFLTPPPVPSSPSASSCCPHPRSA